MENVGDMIYMSGCCQEEEEEEGDGEHGEKNSLLKNAKLLLGNNAGCNQLAWTRNHVTASISFSSSMQPSAVYNAVSVNTVHCVTLCITLCCTGHRALAHVGECQPDVSGRAVRIQ